MWNLEKANIKIYNFYLFLLDVHTELIELQLILWLLFSSLLVEWNWEEVVALKCVKEGRMTFSRIPFPDVQLEWATGRSWGDLEEGGNCHFIISAQWISSSTKLDFSHCTLRAFQGSTGCVWQLTEGSSHRLSLPCERLTAEVRLDSTPVPEFSPHRLYRQESCTMWQPRKRVTRALPQWEW